ncbi:MAG: hypothetical protein H6604_04290 [Flavobacteriales bacterium]|nr:hypothetical protein [Flavobacteriales bacterium]
MNNTPLESEDFYFSEQGFKVFTEKYHLKRGYCCKSGCKHCPYGYNKRIDLFDSKNKNKNKPK